MDRDKKELISISVVTESLVSKTDDIEYVLNMVDVKISEEDEKKIRRIAREITTILAQGVMDSLIDIRKAKREHTEALANKKGE